VEFDLTIVVDPIFSWERLRKTRFGDQTVPSSPHLAPPANADERPTRRGIVIGSIKPKSDLACHFTNRDAGAPYFPHPILSRQIYYFKSFCGLS
jgi:hypothetical protein